MGARRLPGRSGVLLAISLLLLAAAVPATAGHGDTGVTVAAIGENSEEFAFDPANPTIEAGENVLFVNESNAPHTLSAGPPGGPFDSGNVFPGGEKVVSTEHLQPGKYPFFCRVHPDIMFGELEVVAP